MADKSNQMKYIKSVINLDLVERVSLYENDDKKVTLVFGLSSGNTIETVYPTIEEADKCFSEILPAFNKSIINTPTL